MSKPMLTYDELNDRVAQLQEELIAQKKQAETFDQNEISYSESIINTAQTIILILDKEGKIIRFNPYMEKLCGYKLEEVIGKDWFTVFLPHEDKEKIRKIFKKAIHQHQTKGNINPIIAKNGKQIFVEWYDTTIKDDKGKVVGLLSTGQDISHRIKSEQRIKQYSSFLDTVIENSPFAMWISDAKGTIVRTNQSLRDKLNLTINKVVGKYNVFKDKNLVEQGIMPQIEAVYKEGKTARFIIHWYSKKSGSIELTKAPNVWIDAVFFPIIETNGEINNVVCQWLDITEQKRIELELKNKNKEYIAVNNELAHSIKRIQSINNELKHKDQKLLMLLKASRAVIKFDKFETTARKLFNICKKYTGAISGYVALLAENGNENEVLFLDAGGMPCTVDENLPMPIRGLRAEAYTKKRVVYDNHFMESDWIKYLPTGHVDLKNVLFAPLIINQETVGVIGLANKPTDFTKEDIGTVEAIAELCSIALYNSKINESLIIAKEKAEESDKLKSAFLANMSHEIRTPMNGILGFTDLLKNTQLSHEKKEQYYDIIQQSGHRMLKIINDLIDISKIEANQTEINLCITNINEQIEYIYGFFKPEVQSKGIMLCFKNALIDKEANIETDNDKLLTIITNLVKNAIKYTSEGGTIEFGYVVKNEFLEFYVKDTGAGIDKKYHDKIFDRFVQAENYLARQYEGAGLGLSISKAYVEMLGGKIWIDSKKNQGSTFYFTLPYKLVLRETSQEKIVVEVEDSATVTVTKKINILIVDDDESAYFYLVEILKDNCNKIYHAKTGVEAIKIFKTHYNILNLILMDIKMPVMNGIETTKKIRKLDRNIPIIAQTAHALEGDEKKCLLAGCSDYIAKPIQKSELFKKIEKYI